MYIEVKPQVIYLTSHGYTNVTLRLNHKVGDMNASNIFFNISFLEEKKLFKFNTIEVKQVNEQLMVSFNTPKRFSSYTTQKSAMK